MTDSVILVPLDGSKDALCALPIARCFAGLEHASVSLLHVSEDAAAADKTSESVGLAPADLAGATFKVRAGRPAETILAAAADERARLIVFSARTAEVPPDGAPGGTALAILRGAHCPVVLVPPAPATDSWRLKCVLAPHDGSPAVSDALKPAMRIAREAGAELIVLQVACDARALETGSMAPPTYIDQLQHSWPAWSEEFLQRLAGVSSPADIRVRLLVEHGDPAEETVRVAKQDAVDLIVVVWRGRWDAPHASILRTLLRDPPCPIMVTRAAPGATVAAD